MVPCCVPRSKPSHPYRRGDRESRLSLAGWFLDVRDVLLELGSAFGGVSRVSTSWISTLPNHESDLPERTLGSRGIAAMGHITPRHQTADRSRHTTGSSNKRYTERQSSRAYHSHRGKTKRTELEENHGSNCHVPGRKRASRDMPHLRRSTPVWRRPNSARGGKLCRLQPHFRMNPGHMGNGSR